MSSLAQAIDQFKDDPLLFQPGTRVAYSSHAFTLLGAVIENVSGTPYAEYVELHIAKPACLTSLKLDSAPHPVRLLAKGYIENKKELTPAPMIDLSNRIPAGGFDDDAEDLVRFAMAAQNGLLLNKNTFAEMIIPQKYVDGKQVIVWKDDSVGLGWFLGLEPLEHNDPGSHWDVASHGGSEPGFSAELYAVPQRNLAIAVLANKDSAGKQLAVLADNIRHIVLGDGSLSAAAMIAASQQGSGESLKVKKTANAQTAAPLIGDWQGSIDTGNNGFIRIALHFTVHNNEISGTLDSPDQGATSIEIDGISFERSTVRFDIAAISGQFEGELRDSQISGKLNQAGASLPVTLTRVNTQFVPQK